MKYWDFLGCLEVILPEHSKDNVKLLIANMQLILGV